MYAHRSEFRTTLHHLSMIQQQNILSLSSAAAVLFHPCHSMAVLSLSWQIGSRRLTHTCIVASESQYTICKMRRTYRGCTKERCWSAALAPARFKQDDHFHTTIRFHLSPCTRLGQSQVRLESFGEISTTFSETASLFKRGLRKWEISCVQIN